MIIIIKTPTIPFAESHREVKYSKYTESLEDNGRYVFSCIESAGDCQVRLTLGNIAAVSLWTAENWSVAPMHQLLLTQVEVKVPIIDSCKRILGVPFPSSYPIVPILMRSPNMANN